MSHLTLHLFKKMRGGNAELLPPAEEMEQEHPKMNATMMNKGGGYKIKDHDKIMNKRKEGEKWSYYMTTPRSQ